MFLRIFRRSSNSGKHKLSFSVLQETFRRFNLYAPCYNKIGLQSSEENHEKLQKLMERYDSKLYYNSVLDSRLKIGYRKHVALISKMKKHKRKMQDAIQRIQPLPLSLKYISKDLVASKLQDDIREEQEKSNNVEVTTQFPYSRNYSINNVTEDISSHETETLSVEDEIRKRNREINNWMSSYDNFEEDINVGDETNDDDNWSVNYGTPDPTSHMSNVPCGGCGAFLHCKDTAFPGYIPSEIFKNHMKVGAATLESMICQRCYFLKEHNMALQVQVSSKDYPKILTTIQGKRALVILIIDLMDFPCSIWPGIGDILGHKIPIFVVGNKVDLLPKDDKGFLNRIKNNLLNNIRIYGLGSANILGASLISAKTMFGIEDMITKLQSLWRYKGDVYIVGCTNVGKSSLFNALLQSDYCKIQAADLIQRATVSQWPGTTLNLLKFPITRLSGYRLILRHQRLMGMQRISEEEKRIRKESAGNLNTASNATLIGHIGQSYIKPIDSRALLKDSFATQGNANALGVVKIGLNVKHPDFVTSRWCFDTPGVVQPDQLINLLTVEELMLTIPKELIRAETFCVHPNSTLFLGGLARLDYLEGPGPIKLTVFRSNALPVTICPKEEADEIYEVFLGTELFKVPIKEGDRLTKWPQLAASKPFTVTGKHWKVSCNDVVLSSAGWVAITCGSNQECKFQAWTPEARGIHIRECFLPKAVMLRGARIRKSVAYHAHRFI